MLFRNCKISNIYVRVINFYSYINTASVMSNKLMLLLQQNVITYCVIDFLLCNSSKEDR